MRVSPFFSAITGRLYPLVLLLNLALLPLRGQDAPTPPSPPAPSTPPPALPVTVSPTDDALRYVGRFDRSDPKGPRCAWSASSVTVHFFGSALNVLLADTGDDFWEVFLDGQPTGAIEIRPDQTLYPVAAGLPAQEHIAELVKRSEFHVGVTQILGFQLDAQGKLLPVPPRPHRIEVIGDSISCGYGNEAATKEEKFTPKAENATIAYGALAARQLDADYICIAWSGKKLWPNNSILDYYDRVLPPGDGAAWDFSSWQPDVVVINLGTNDFGMTNPDGPGWVAAYKALLVRLRAQYPNAAIYCTLGTMLGDWPADRKPASLIRGYLTGLTGEFQAAGDTKIRFLDFGTQKPENGYGGSWHPSAKTHQLMADQLVKTLRQDLGW